MKASANQTNRRVPGETAAKVLLYDIETSPMVGYTWGPRWESSLIEVLEEKMIMSFAWKWLGESQIRCLALPDFKGYKRRPKDNKALLRRLHELIAKADIVIAHNVDRFDDKMANTDFIVNHFEPPPPHKTVDTLKVARSKFAFSSNRLDDLGRRLGVGRKIKHPGWPMWRGCLDGDLESWAQMRLYNIGDVALLERVYLRIRPWMTNHPSMTAFEDVPGCPKCGASRVNMIVNKKYVISGSFKKLQFRCRTCGGYVTGSKTRGDWVFK